MFIYHGVYIDQETLDNSRENSGFDYFHENHTSCLKEDGPIMSFSCSYVEDDFRVIHVWNFIKRDLLGSL